MSSNRVAICKFSVLYYCPACGRKSGFIKVERGCLLCVLCSTIIVTPKALRKLAKDSYSMKIALWEYKALAERGREP